MQFADEYDFGTRMCICEQASRPTDRRDLYICQIHSLPQIVF